MVKESPAAEIVRLVTSALVDNPSEIRMEVIDGESTQVIEVRPAKSDVGKIIGKQGRTADAIRTIITAVGSKSGKRVMLQILDD